MNEYITVKEAAQILGRRIPTVHSKIYNGMLPATVGQDGRYRIKRTDLARYQQHREEVRRLSRAR